MSLPTALGSRSPDTESRARRSATLGWRMPSCNSSTLRHFRPAAVRHDAVVGPDGVLGDLRGRRRQRRRRRLRHMDGARGLIEVLAELAAGRYRRSSASSGWSSAAARARRDARRRKRRRAGKTPQDSAPIGPGVGKDSRRSREFSGREFMERVSVTSPKSSNAQAALRSDSTKRHCAKTVHLEPRTRPSSKAGAAVL